MKSTMYWKDWICLFIWALEEKLEDIEAIEASR